MIVITTKTTWICPMCRFATIGDQGTALCSREYWNSAAFSKINDYIMRNIIVDKEWRLAHMISLKLCAIYTGVCSPSTKNEKLHSNHLACVGAFSRWYRYWYWHCWYLHHHGTELSNAVQGGVLELFPWDEHDQTEIENVKKTLLCFQNHGWDFIRMLANSNILEAIEDLEVVGHLPSVCE